jgi:DNA primase
MNKEIIIPIKKVSTLLGIEMNYNGRRAKNCPFCGSRTAFSMDEQNNTFHCFACGEKGNSISLYAKMMKVNNKEAFKTLLAIGEEKKEREEKKEAFISDKRYEVNKSLLEQLNLSEDHRENLLDRGLTDSEIQSLGYKTLDYQSMSFSERDELCKKIFEEKFDEYERIPGFYDLNTDTPKISYQKRGFLIPVKNFRRQIEGFQIRYDSLPSNASEMQKAMFHRYGWLSSSNKETGIKTSGIGNIHHAGNWYYMTRVKKVCITEGALKADIAASISDRMHSNETHLFLGLTGVQNTSQLKAELELLANFQLRKVSLCVDMDYLTNKNVKQALENIKKVVQEVHYRDDNGNLVSLDYKVIKWDENYKGIDDYLKHVWNIKYSN